MKQFVKTFIFSILITLSANGYAGTNVMFTASIDSVSIMMGKQARIDYQIVQDKGVEGYVKQDNPKLLSPYVEIIRETRNDTTDLDNNRIQINRQIVITSFDSGIWEIPAAKYIVAKDTFLSNSLSLKVIPANVDTLTTIHTYKPVSGVPFNLLDYLPDFIYYYWWLILLVIVLIAGGIFFYLRMKNQKPLFAPKKVEVPPYEEAITALNDLKAEKLWQAGHDKEYFTKLTDILRRYIDRRFAINAVEMTSSEIIETLKRNEETRAVNEQLKQILEVADFVKFANMRALPDDSEGSWNKAQHFVEETKPQPLPDPESEKQDAKDDKKPAANITKDNN